MKIDYLPLIVNIICCAWYILEGKEPGKMLYWGGATILVVGLIKMKG